jgi:RpiB/LacA/LacB family sugar-phosphate isomerase
MRIAIGSDHAGFNLKQILVEELIRLGHDVEDKGADHGDTPIDNYHLIGASVAESVVMNEVDRGIVICGTGIGISIAANKVPGADCALCHDLYTARYSRLHNNSNVLAIGSRLVGDSFALEIMRTWLKTPFEGNRHKKRNENLRSIEKKFNSQLEK